jgi:hypothetical protein
MKEGSNNAQKREASPEFICLQNVSIYPSCQSVSSDISLPVMGNFGEESCHLLMEIFFWLYQQFLVTNKIQSMSNLKISNTF